MADGCWLLAAGCSLLTVVRIVLPVAFPPLYFDLALATLSQVYSTFVNACGIEHFSLLIVEGRR
jgi:hypothetical protein